ncbi:MAG: amidohydrolase family protein [Lachnospiraceae bacterium]|nr:amidohydrolase family protein [Lachnospiraceae bacterium]
MENNEKRQRTVPCLTFALHGDVCYAQEPGKPVCREDSYVVCVDGKCAGVFDVLPEKFKGIEVINLDNMLITPGFVDLHLHAPQYSYRGLGMDMELLDWLEEITFPEEAKYADDEYAKEAYGVFVSDLRKSPTTRANIFATIHKDATLTLMKQLEEAGLAGYVGKVNMDRNSPDTYRETEEGSVRTTLEWLDECGDFEHIKPIITPRFVPSCTDGLMRELGRIASERALPVQSHLSENISEVEWVKELAPDSKGYADAYDRFGLFGNAGPCVMAHCIYMRDDEIELMKKRGVFVAHSPQSNMNIRSGIAPMRRFFEDGVKCGLASDVAAGSSINMFKAVTDAIQVSKLYWRLIDDSRKALTFPEAFYLATKGGGEFFGKVGSFEEGYEFDAIAIDDSMAKTNLELNIAQRLERTMYLGHAGFIKAKFVAGRRLF